MRKVLYLSIPFIFAGLGNNAYSKPEGGEIPPENEKMGVNAELELGVQHDSSLSVTELDRSITQSDKALLAKAKLNGKWEPDDEWTLRAGYSYSGINYRENSEFDIDIHQLFVDGSYDFDLITLGTSHYFAAAQLDGRDLLDLNRTSLYVSRLFDKRIFVRLAADLTDKDFDDRPERSADNTAFDGDLYYFFNQARTFISLGIRAENEDAKGSRFDYQGITFSGKASNKFKLAHKNHRISLEYRYQDRDYDNIDQDIGAERADTRQTTELAWEIWFNEHLALVNSLQYGDYGSNLESIDFSETLAAMSLRLKW